MMLGNKSKRHVDIYFAVGMTDEPVGTYLVREYAGKRDAPRFKSLSWSFGWLACWLVGWSIGPSVCNNFLKGKVH